MKKKLLVFALLLAGVFTFAACGQTKIDLKDYLIEERETLFSCSDDLYTLTYSGGMCEENYSLNGEINNLVPFGIITFARKDHAPLANDTYKYTLTINDTEYTGELEKNATDNNYSIDVGVNAPTDANIKIKIAFSGYTFDSELDNVSGLFEVDKDTALKIATDCLQDNVKNILSNKDTKIEVVSKVIKDYSNSEISAYYWYIGVVSTNGETLGVLIDAHTGDIIAKKV